MSRPAQITRRLEFDAGHRLLRHESKCRNLHGHRYTLELTCEAAELDAVGRVIDFGVVKAVVGGWIDEMLDHGYIGERGDPLLAAAVDAGSKVHVVDFPPTAEHLAAYLFEVASNLLSGSYKIRVVRVRLYETPNGWADYPSLAGDQPTHPLTAELVHTPVKISTRQPPGGHEPYYRVDHLSIDKAKDWR